MEHNNFIDEIDEELKVERVRNFGHKFAPLLLFALFGLLVLVGAWRAYAYMREQKIEKLGDSFTAVLDNADSTSFAQVLENLNKLETATVGNYPELIRLYKANLFKKNGDAAKSKQQLLLLVQNPATPLLLKNAANIKLAHLLVDEGNVDAVTKTVAPFLKEENAFQLLAWEALGLVYAKQNGIKQAESYFNKILEHDKTSSGVAQRARLMLDVLTAE